MMRAGGPEAPEASVSALVYAHPDCTYFSVGDAAES